MSKLSKTENGAMTPLIVDLSTDLPNLNDYKPAPLDLMADYWSPETPGESKRVLFTEIRQRMILDQASGEQIELESAYFLEQVEGDWRVVSNGSKRLVAALVNRGVKPGTALLIKYLGKLKNKTNNFKSDNWSVKTLILEI